MANLLALGGQIIGGGGNCSASNVDYNNTTSGLLSTDVQSAIDELSITPAKINVNSSLVTLKASSFMLNLKNYSSSYGGSLANGFNGQYIIFTLSELKKNNILTNFSKILNTYIYWWSSDWRANYPNGRIIGDGNGETIIVILGTNFVDTKCEITLMCIGY